MRRLVGAALVLVLVGGAPLQAQEPVLRREFAGHPQMVAHLTFSPDGKLLAASCGDGTVKVWDVAAGRERFTFKHSQWAFEAAFAPDGKWLATCSTDGTVRLWDLDTGKE